MTKQFNFDFPTPELVAEYVKRFDEENNQADYYKDIAIRKVFDAFPKNTETGGVFAKVEILNSFYGTRILDIDLLKVVEDIIRLDIDKRINGDTVDISVVNDIAYKHESYDRNLYSFASKYCSFHNPSKFPIVDSFSKGMLYYMNTSNNKDFKFFEQSFTQADLNNFFNYCKIYNAFINHFKLNKISFKNVDKYLWKYGKDEMGSKIQITDTTVYLDKIL